MIGLKGLRSLYISGLMALPVIAGWIWWQDGMWKNGSLPTHGLIHVCAGCAVALFLHGVLWLKNRKQMENC